MAGIWRAPPQPLTGSLCEIWGFCNVLQGDWDESDPKKPFACPMLPGLLRLGKGIIFALVWSKLSATLNPALMESAWWGTLPVWRR